MATPSVIKDSFSGNAARVTKFGQLVVAPLQYSTPISDTLDVIDTAFNFVSPAQDQSIIITDIIISASRTVGVNGADVVVYQSDAPDSIIVDKEIVELDMVKQSSISLIGLNLIVPEGKYVNAKTDDADVLVTLMFYRAPVEDI